MPAKKSSTGSVWLRETTRTPPGWYVSARLPDGRRIQRRLGPAWQSRGRPPAGYLTKRMAEDELRLILADGDRGTLDAAYAPPSGRTFGQATDLWLHFVEHDKACSPSTLSDYRSIVLVHLLPEFGEDTPLDRITQDAVEDYRSRLLAGSLSRRTVQKLMICMNGILKRAKRRGWIASNPCVNVERVQIRASGDFNVLSIEEVEAVVRAAEDPVIAAAITVAAFSGLRKGELCGLRWIDVDFAARMLHVRRQVTPWGVTPPKSGKVRSVPLIDQAAKALDGLSRREHFTGPEDTVFANEVGDPVRGDLLPKLFYAALLAAGLGHKRWLVPPNDEDPSGTLKPDPMVFHDLRHSFASLAVQVWDLPRVQMYCGHADIATTMRYVHSIPRTSDADALTRLVAASSAQVGQTVGQTR